MSVEAVAVEMARERRERREPNTAAYRRAVLRDELKSRLSVTYFNADVEVKSVFGMLSVRVSVNRGWACECSGGTALVTSAQIYATIGHDAMTVEESLKRMGLNF